MRQRHVQSGLGGQDRQQRPRLALVQSHGAFRNQQHAARLRVQVAFTQKGGGPGGCGLPENLGSSPDLYQPPGPHQSDVACQHAGLALIVRDQQHACPLLGKDRFQLQPQRGPQLFVEVAQRFIEQQQGRAGSQGAGQRHPLLLPARQLVNAPVP